LQHLCKFFVVTTDFFLFLLALSHQTHILVIFFNSQKVTVKIKRGKVTASRALPDGTRLKKVQQHAQSVLLERMNLIPNPNQMNVRLHRRENTQLVVV
jgi:hypothetical protein